MADKIYGNADLNRVRDANLTIDLSFSCVRTMYVRTFHSDL